MLPLRTTLFVVQHDNYDNLQIRWSISQMLPLGIAPQHTVTLLMMCRIIGYIDILGHWIFYNIYDLPNLMPTSSLYSSIMPKLDEHQHHHMKS